MKTLASHLLPDGPKRILALDGGGIRGALSLGILEKIEDELRRRHHKPDLVLSDYFDLIGGTSTGSIIATLLALGKPVADIRDLYFSLGQKIFGDRNILTYLKAQFNQKPLEEALKAILGNRTLGSEDLRTGLCIVAKRADTYSLWPMINHPGGKFYANPDLQAFNRDLPLWQLIRASTAAPTYFQAQKINLGDQQAAFIDGGVSSANNPSLMLFLIATADGFPFHWSPGNQNLCLVSVGTGTSRKVKDPNKFIDYNILGWAKELPDYFMDDANYLNQTMMQYMSESPTAEEIDMELGKCANNLFHSANKALFYLRYNGWLDYRKRDHNGHPIDNIPNLENLFPLDRLEGLRDMANPDNCHDLYMVGRITGDFYVKPEHFPERFDVTF